MKGERADQVWEEHCADTQLLSQYANAMHQLAKGFWSDSIDGSRITWCHNYIDSYFYGGILHKLRLKDVKRLQYNKTGNKSLERVSCDVFLSLIEVSKISFFIQRQK